MAGEESLDALDYRTIQSNPKREKPEGEVSGERTGSAPPQETAPARPAELREVKSTLPPLDVAASKDMEPYARADAGGTFVIGLPQTEVEDVAGIEMVKKIPVETHDRLLKEAWQRERAKAQGIRHIAPDEMTYGMEQAAINALLSSYETAQGAARTQQEGLLGRELAEDPLMLRAIAYDEQLTPELLYGAKPGEVPKIDLQRITEERLRSAAAAEAAEHHVDVESAYQKLSFQYREVREETDTIDRISQELGGLAAEVRLGTRPAAALETRIAELKRDPGYGALDANARSWIVEYVRRAQPTIAQVKAVDAPSPASLKNREVLRKDILHMVRQFTDSSGKMEVADFGAYMQNLWNRPETRDMTTADEIGVVKALLPHEPFKSKPELLPFLLPPGEKLPAETLAGFREPDLSPEQEASVSGLFDSVAALKKDRMAVEKAFLALKNDARFKSLDAAARIVLFDRLQRNELTTGDARRDLSLLTRRRMVIEGSAGRAFQAFRKRKDGSIEDLTASIVNVSPTTGERMSNRYKGVELEAEDNVIFLERQALERQTEDATEETIDPRDYLTVAEREATDAATLAERLSKARLKAMVIRAPKE